MGRWHMHIGRLQCTCRIRKRQLPNGATPTEQIRCYHVDNAAQDDPELGPDLLEDQVARAMETARKRSGLTVEAMARRLRPALRLPAVGAEKQVRNNWYGWRKAPGAIPAVALVAAARLAGTSVDALLSESAEPATEGRLARLEREVAEQQRVIDELREHLDRTSSQPTAREERHRARS